MVSNSTVLMLFCMSQLSTPLAPGHVLAHRMCTCTCTCMCVCVCVCMCVCMVTFLRPDAQRHTEIASCCRPLLKAVLATCEYEIPGHCPRKLTTA